MKKPPSRNSFWICLSLAVIFLGIGLSRLFATNIYDQEGWWKFLLLSLPFGLAALLLKRRNDAAQKEFEAAVQRQIDAELQEKARQREEADAEAKRKAAWEAAHGVITTRLAGVTFDNEDGSSRQRALQGALADECTGDVELELYDWKGQDAVRVLYDGVCVGNIPRDRVAEVAAVMDRITAGSLSVNRFTPEDEDDETSRRGGVIYRADLTIVYSR